MRLAGRASGRNSLEWPLGKWAEKTGRRRGDVAGAGRHAHDDARARCPTRIAAELPICRAKRGPSIRTRRSATCRSPDTSSMRSIPSGSRSTRAGRRRRRPTSSSRDGRRSASARGFRSTSPAWTGRRAIACSPGIMTAFGAPTGAVPIGGNGEFDGVMLESFTQPRIEGTFTGDRMRAWDVIWGSGRADVVIENSYVFVSNARRHGGRLGDPRRRAVLARLSAEGRRRGDRRARPRQPAAADGPAPRLQLDDYPVDGARVGRIPPLWQVRDAVRLRQACRSRRASPTARRSRRATSSLRFEGDGVRLDAHRHREEQRLESPAPRSSGGTATTRSTPTARGFPSSR